MTATPKAGHNLVREELGSLVTAIEALEEQKQAIADEIKAKMADAKATGFDTKTIRKIINARKLDLDARREQRNAFDLYAEAIDLYGDRELV